jgi:hypothetical protein
MNDSRWKKGESGNPKGRPRGSRNRSTIVLEQMLEGTREQLLQKATELALDGSIPLLKTFLKQMPIRREAPIRIPVRRIRTIEDADAALADLHAAIAEGQITAAEADLGLRLIEAQMKVITETSGASPQVPNDARLSALTEQELTMLSEIMKKLSSPP